MGNNLIESFNNNIQQTGIRLFRLSIIVMPLLLMHLVEPVEKVYY